MKHILYVRRSQTSFVSHKQEKKSEKINLKYLEMSNINKSIQNETQKKNGKKKDQEK